MEKIQLFENSFKIDSKVFVYLDKIEKEKREIKKISLSEELRSLVDYQKSLMAQCQKGYDKYENIERVQQKIIRTKKALKEIVL